MRQFSKLAVALALAGLSSAPVPQVAQNHKPVLQNTTGGPRRAQQPAPVPRANLSAMSLRAMLDPIGGSGITLAPFWPHNRPQPGWRAVQSRRRHRERLRRQRRNAA
jgi:hypothetical protein